MISESVPLLSETKRGLQGVYGPLSRLAMRTRRLREVGSKAETTARMRKRPPNDAFDARPPQSRDRFQRLILALDAVDRLLHDRIEALHAEARPAAAGFAERRPHLLLEGSRVDFHRNLGIARKSEALPQQPHEIEKFFRLDDDRRRAAAEMDVIDGERLVRLFGDEPDLLAQHVQMIVDRDRGGRVFRYGGPRADQ